MAEQQHEQPLTPTNTSGEEAINRSSSQGLIVGDGDSDRVLIGFQKDGFGTGNDYGIKVSQDGVDVKTAPDDDLIMSSAFNMFKIVASGTLAMTFTPGADTTTTTVSATHGLGYVPAFQAFITLDPGIMSGTLANSTVPNPYPILYLIGGTNDLTLVGMAQVYVDSTKVYFTMQEDGIGGGPYSCSAKYYLFQETFT